MEPDQQLGDTPQTEIPPFQRKRKIITFNRKHCVACMAINRQDATCKNFQDHCHGAHAVLKRKTCAF